MSASGTMTLPNDNIAQSMDILGVLITDTSREEALGHLQQALKSRRHIKLAFCNAHTANLAYADDEARAVLSGFTVLADGIGVDIAAKILHGRSFAANLNGTDFVPQLLSQTPQSLTIAMFGSAPGVALRARNILKTAHPHHRFSLVQHGFGSPEEITLFLETLRENPVDVLLVAMGNPRQEQFIANSITAEHATLAIGVGALFDFIAGEVVRAPRWVRSIRMEWAFRLMQEPKRLFQRYVLGNPLFLLRVLAAKLGMGRK